MIPTTLLASSRAHASTEQALADKLRAAIASHGDAALIIEGLASGAGVLEGLSALRMVRLAPACLCCAGNLVLKVHLNRILRQPPKALFLFLADARHVPQLHTQLSTAPYDSYLQLTADCLL